MKYFIDHDKSTNYDISGIISIQNNYIYNPEASIEGISINNSTMLNRSFHLDTVSLKRINNEYIVSNVINRNYFTLVGILELDSKIKYGFNKKNVPYYIFKPTDKKYPPFYVASKSRLNAKVYAIVTYSHWNSDDKYPYGNCMNIIGEIGEMDNEYQHILQLYSLQYANLNHTYKRVDVDFIKGDRLDLRENDIMSIDPPGCRDIDDAFDLIGISDTEYQLGIHIADVSNFIHPDSELDVKIKQRLSSVYSPHKTVNMLPNIYSDDICSLLPEKDRYAFSLLMRIDKEGNIISYNFHKTIIHSKKALTYEEANHMIEKKDLILCKTLELTKKIHTIYNFEINNSDSSSGYIVQVLMILANKLAAETIYKSFPGKSLLRTHINTNMLVDGDNDLQKHLYLKNMNAATYEISPKNTRHDTLNLELYTHFTSPIRRYADIIVHRILMCCIGLLEENSIGSNMCEIVDNINLRNKQVRKAELKWNKLKLIKQLNNKSEKTQAYIIEYYDSSKKIEIYIPKYRIGIKTRIFHRKLDTILTYNYQDNCIIISDRDGNKLSLHLYELINIELTPFLQKVMFDEKLDIIFEQNVFAFNG